MLRKRRDETCVYKGHGREASPSSLKFCWGEETRPELDMEAWEGRKKKFGEGGLTKFTSSSMLETRPACSCYSTLAVRGPCCCSFLGVFLHDVTSQNHRMPVVMAVIVAPPFVSAGCRAGGPPALSPWTPWDGAQGVRKMKLSEVKHLAQSHTATERGPQRVLTSIPRVTTGFCRRFSFICLRVGRNGFCSSSLRVSSPGQAPSCYGHSQRGPFSLSPLPPRWSSRPCTTWSPVAMLWAGSSPSVCWWESSSSCCWPCCSGRWASFAEDTKKLLKPRRTGKRTKTVGTGSKKASDLPHPSRDPIISPVVLDLCIFHIWKKESSPDFSEAPLMLFSSSLCHARAPTRGSHFGQVPWLEPPPLPFTDELWTLESELRSQAIFMDATCVVNPQGKTVNLKIFL